MRRITWSSAVDTAAVKTTRGAISHPQCHKRTEAHHGYAGSDALVTAESHAGTKAGTDRGGEGDDDQVGGGVQGHGEDTEQEKFHDDVPEGRVYRMDGVW